MDSYFTLSFDSIDFMNILIVAGSLAAFRYVTSPANPPLRSDPDPLPACAYGKKMTMADMDPQSSQVPSELRNVIDHYVN